MLADQTTAVPGMLRDTLKLLVEEIRLLEARIAQLERELTAVAKASAPCETLLSIPGIGLLTASAMVAATGGDVTHFKDARHFASWFGLIRKNTPPGLRDTWVISANAVIDTCACSSLTAPGPSCALRPSPKMRQTARCASLVGSGVTEPIESQQGDLRTRQQARSDLFRHSSRWRAV